jgi:NADP-dependent 3-hydroxy acid dehydrogenase YdfG
VSNLKGKIAWVTGAGTGIGRAGAIELARAGAHVVLSGRRAETLKETAALIKKAKGTSEIAVLDVADMQAVDKVAAGIVKKHKRIDILVNSAGINVPHRAFADVQPEGWKQVIDINLHGTMYCVMAVLPRMRTQQDGLIINVSSWAGKFIGKLTGPAYNASKFGVVALTETINAEECGNGIRACALCPAEVATPIMDRRPVPPSKEDRGRMLQEEDLGKTILFVASLPARACVNEIIISPTHNRGYLGGFESNRPAADRK